MTLNPLIILVAAVFTHNIALTYLIGMCPMLAMSRRIDTAVGMGVAVTFVLAIIGPLNWLIYRFLLVPTHSEVMSFLVFIIVIASAVQLVEMLVARFFPALHSSFGVFLPLITVNCAVLAVSLFVMLREYSLWQTVTFSIGTGIGWGLATTIIAGIRERLVLIGDVPADLRGAGITMVIAGILALAFIGFSGMVAIQ
jgi:Na+-transporting NADH:ubiquinone oxidoreductase subunit E